LRTERNGGMWSRRPRPYMGCSADQKKKKIAPVVKQGSRYTFI
jgi:hypothetical protein